MKRRALIQLTPMVFFLASSALYFIPYPLSFFAFTSESISPRIRIDYSASTGFVVVCAILACLIGVILYPQGHIRFDIYKRYRWESIALTLMLIMLGAYTALTPELYLETKADVLESTNRGHLLFYAICSIGFVYSFLVGWRAERINFILSSLGLALIMFIGHRSALALAILAIFYISFRNTSITKIRFRYVVISIILLFFLAIYKSIYRLIKAGLISDALDNLGPDNITGSILVGLEQFVIFLHLDYVVTQNYVPECSNIWLIPVSIIPFSDQFINAESCTFTGQIHPLFFSEFSGGVGANIWAEFYSYLGLFGLPVLVLIIALFALMFEWIINKTTSALLKSGFIIAMMHIVFYIQRKELFGAFISAKRVIIAVLIIFFAGYMIKLLLKKQHKPNIIVTNTP
jgi:hypothetical protein